MVSPSLVMLSPFASLRVYSAKQLQYPLEEKQMQILRFLPMTGIGTSLRMTWRQGFPATC